MARIPTLKRLPIEDFKDQSGWIGKLLEPLNQFLQIVTYALTNQITFSQNIDAQIVNLTISTKKALTTGPTGQPDYATLYEAPSFRVSTNNTPQGVLVWMIKDLTTSSELMKYGATIDWSYANGSIQINNITGLEPDHKYAIRLLVCGG
jgi:hypothetical protein